MNRDDPEVREFVRELYRALPDDEKHLLDRVARLRFGLLAYLGFLVAYLLISGHRGVGSFLQAFASLQFIAAIILAAIGVVVVTRKAMTASAIVVAEFQIMAPDHADEIAQVYGERGLGDVLAPWVRRRQGRIGQARTALFRGLMPWDRRR